MDIPERARHDWAGRLLFLVGLVLVLQLHLLSALLAGLLVHGLVTVIAPVLRVPKLGRDGTRALVVAGIAIFAIGALVGLTLAVLAVIRDNTESLPALAERMAEILDASRNQVPAWVLPYLPHDAEQLRLAAVDWLRANANTFSVAGQGLGRGLTHIIVGMVIGMLVVLDGTVRRDDVGPLAVTLRERARALGRAFRGVVFAQVRISAINTVLTGVYLALGLPILGVHLPFTKTLIAVTFIVGLMPILGNLISNTAIFVVSFSQSPMLAVGSLAYLIVIHKLE